MKRLGLKNKQSDILVLAIALLSYLVTLLSGQTYSDFFKNSEAHKIYYAPPSELKHFTFGFKETTADSFWIRVLQDIDRCEQNFAPKGAPRMEKNRVYNCDKGWVYHMLDIIFECAPKWRIPAAIGPLLLSVIVDDINGATLLFKKAIKNFPSDWSILYRAAYHFLYETDDMLLAAQLYDEAAKNGAPQWAHSLAAKLYSETGRNYVARIVLNDALKRTPPGKIREKIQARLEQVEAAIKKMENNK